MDALRRKAGKPDLPVWFVAFGDGRTWADQIATAATTHKNMGVTHSSRGQYGNASNVRPAPSAWASSISAAVIALGEAGLVEDKSPR